MNRPSKHELMMSFAVLASKRSTCSRLQVGCVLTDPEMEMISFGYNGGPKGGRNECARHDAGSCGCLHAEINAALKAPRGLTFAFGTDTPCESCAIALVNYGIEYFCYLRAYRLSAGLDILRERGVELELLDSPWLDIVGAI